MEKRPNVSKNLRNNEMLFIILRIPNILFTFFAILLLFIIVQYIYILYMNVYVLQDLCFVRKLVHNQHSYSEPSLVHQIKSIRPRILVPTWTWVLSKKESTHSYCLKWLEPAITKQKYN